MKTPSPTTYNERWMSHCDRILETCTSPLWPDAANLITREITVKIQKRLVDGLALSEGHKERLLDSIRIRLRKDVSWPGVIKLTDSQLKDARRTHSALRSAPAGQVADLVTRAEYNELDDAMQAQAEVIFSQAERIDALEAQVSELVAYLQSARESTQWRDSSAKHPESTHNPTQFHPESTQGGFDLPRKVSGNGPEARDSHPIREEKVRESTSAVSQAQQRDVSSFGIALNPALSSFKEEEHLGNSSRAPEAPAFHPAGGFDGQHEARKNKAKTKAQHSVVLYQAHGKTYGRAMIDGVNYRVQFMPYEKAHRTLWNNSVDRTWADALNASDGAYSASLAHKFGASCLYADDDKFTNGLPARLDAMLLAFWSDTGLVELRVAQADQVAVFDKVKAPAGAMFKGIVK